MQEFIFAFPLWVLMRDGRPARITEADQPFVPLFTEEYLAEKFREQAGIPTDILPVKNATDLTALLRWIQAKKIDHIGLDPTDRSVPPVLSPIAEVLAVFEGT